MALTSLLQAPHYDPNLLLDTVIDMLGLKSDAALSRTLGMLPMALSRVRHHKLPAGAGMLIRMHEETGLSIAALRKIMGDRRSRLRSPRQMKINWLGYELSAQNKATTKMSSGRSEQSDSTQKVKRTRALPRMSNLMFAITRNETNLVGNAHWYVKITRDDRTYCARFYDGTYPNTDSALAAAQAFRNALLASLPAPRSHSAEATPPDVSTIKQIERDVRIQYGQRPATIKKKSPR